VQTPVVEEVKLWAPVSPVWKVADTVTGEADSEVVPGPVKLIVGVPLAMVPVTVEPVAVTGVPWLSVALIA
jgi:hypothetical protein